MRLVAEASAAAKGFKPLILPHHAPKTLFGTGARSARMAGAGEDFFQYRDYGFGDNAQQIDWRQSARSDDIYIRERERMLPHRIYLYCDPSPAMQFNSRGSLPTKSYAAQRLLLAVSALLMQGEGNVMPLSGAPGRRSLDELARMFSDETQGEFPRMQKLPARSYVIIASDFHQGSEIWQKIIAEISEMGAIGICIQMLDPIEEEFPLYGRVRLESAEDDSSMIIPSADIVRPIYLERLKREQNVMQKTCMQYGWRWMTMSSDVEPRRQLSQLLQLLAQQ